MIKSVKVAIPPVREAQPKWDLRLVLAVLARVPFEPIGTCDFKYLTSKTAFLVLLGSACRRSELHALDYQTLQHDPHWKWVDLFTLPGFWAKHQASDTDPSRSRVYRLQAMDSTLDRKERLICPVRALKWYVTRTAVARGTKRRLFLSLKSPKKDVHANTITSWIKKLITYAYDHATPEERRVFQIDDGPPNLHRPAHEVRAWSSTISWLTGSISIQALMEGCYWKSHSVFTNHYLRSVTVDTMEGLKVASRFLPSKKHQ